MRTHAVAVAALAGSGCLTIVLNEPPSPTIMCEVDDEAPPPAKAPVAAATPAAPRAAEAPHAIECLRPASGDDCTHARELLAQRPAGARMWATLVRGPTDVHLDYDPVTRPGNGEPPLMVETFAVELPEPRRLRAVELYPAHHPRTVTSMQIIDAYGHEAAHDVRLMDTSDPTTPVRVIDVGCDKPPIAAVRIGMRYELPSDSGDPFGAIAGLPCD